MLLKAPPENRFKRAKMVSASNSCGFIPGTTTNEPSRKMANNNRVQSNFFRRSGSLKAVFIASSILYHLGLSAGRLNFGHRRFAKAFGLNRQFFGEFAAAQNFHPVPGVFNNSAFQEKFGGYFCAVVKPV